MKRLFIIYGIESLLLCLFVSMGLFNAQNDIYSLIITSIFTVEFFLFGLITDKDIQKESILVIVIFFVGFILRYGLICYDDYSRAFEFEWIGDCKDFRESAINFFYTNKAKFRSRDFDTTTLLLGLVNKVYGPQRMIVRYINTLSFMIGSLLIYRVMKKINISENIRNILIAWMIFSPQNIKNTIVSNREGYIQLLIAVSVFAFILYVKQKRFMYIAVSFIAVFIACGFHGGCIATLFGYIFYILFSERENKIYKTNVKSIVLFAFFVLAFGIIYTQYGDILFAKFSNVESVEDIAARNKYNDGGGSDYHIPGGDATTIGALLLTSPIRMVYFLLSPMPWYWRGIMDIGAFIATSIPQILIALLSLKCIPKMKNTDNKMILIAFLVSVIAIALIFGWGCKNAGTAIRHRDKFMSFYVIILAILYNSSIKLKSRLQK